MKTKLVGNSVENDDNRDGRMGELWGPIHREWTTAIKNGK